MEQFTPQEWIYLAAAVRSKAVEAEDRAKALGIATTMYDTALFAATIYRELAAKCERMAKITNSTAAPCAPTSRPRAGPFSRP